MRELLHNTKIPISLWGWVWTVRRRSLAAREKAWRSLSTTVGCRALRACTPKRARSQACRKDRIRSLPAVDGYLRQEQEGNAYRQRSCADFIEKILVTPVPKCYRRRESSGSSFNCDTVLHNLNVHFFFKAKTVPKTNKTALSTGEQQTKSKLPCYRS